MTKEQYQDYELVLEWKIETGGNIDQDEAVPTVARFFTNSPAGSNGSNGTPPKTDRNLVHSDKVSGLSVHRKLSFEESE